MDPNQHPSTADWWITDHKSWGTTIPTLRTVIAYNFAELRTKEEERKCRQLRHVARFKQQISLVCQEIAGEQEWQEVEHRQSTCITACIRLAEAIRTQQFWASFGYQNIRKFSYRHQCWYADSAPALRKRIFRTQKTSIALSWCSAAITRPQ